MYEEAWFNSINRSRKDRTLQSQRPLLKINDGTLHKHRQDILFAKLDLSTG